MELRINVLFAPENLQYNGHADFPMLIGINLDESDATLAPHVGLQCQHTGSTSDKFFSQTNLAPRFYTCIQTFYFGPRVAISRQTTTATTLSNSLGGGGVFMNKI